MAFSLICNENFLNLSTLDFGDINIFGLIHVYPTGSYWHTSKSTPLNVKTIYDWLVANNYPQPTYNLTLENVERAWNGDQAYLNDFENNRYWLVGGFSKGFGVYFARDTTNRVQLMGFSYNPDTHTLDSYGIICNTTTDSVSTGSNDNNVYFPDYLYQEGAIWENRRGLLQGRYEVTVNEGLEREWYYYNNIDMVMINDTDTAWKDLINRKCPYFATNNISTYPGRTWLDNARNSDYRERPDPFKNSGGNTKPDGGNGVARVSIDIPMPTAPPDMLLESGIVKIYKPTASQISNFIDFVYSQPTSIADNFKKIWADPMQSIISLGIVPFDVSAKDTSEIVKFCGISTNVSMNQVSTQFPTWNFGELTLPEETCSFLDYASYTKVKINLPFIGICDLNVDDVMNATLTLEYIFDVATGECVANIKCTKYDDDYKIGYNSLLYEFNGNMLAQAPLSSNNWQGLYQGVLSTAATIFQGMGTGNVAGAAVSSAVDFLTSNKVEVKRSGSIQGNGSHLSNYIPYLIVECPIVSTTTEMFERQGYPFNRMYDVNYLHTYKTGDMKKAGAGYTVFQKDSVFVNIQKATDEEKLMIKNILESGVIL